MDPTDSTPERTGIQRLEKELEQQQRATAELDLELERSRTEQDLLLERVRGELQQTQSELAAAQAAVEAGSQKVQDLRAVRDDLRQQHQSEVRQVRDQAVQLGTAAATTEADLRRRLGQLERSLATELATRQDLATRLAEVASERVSLQQHAGQADSTRDSLAGEIDYLKSRLGEIEEHARRSEEELTRRLQAAADAESQALEVIETLQGDLETAATEVADLRVQLEQTHDEADAVHGHQVAALNHSTEAERASKVRQSELERDLEDALARERETDRRQQASAETHLRTQAERDGLDRQLIEAHRESEALRQHLDTALESSAQSETQDTDLEAVRTESAALAANLAEAEAALVEESAHSADVTYLDPSPATERRGNRPSAPAVIGLLAAGAIAGAALLWFFDARLRHPERVTASIESAAVSPPRPSTEAAVAPDAQLPLAPPAAEPSPTAADLEAAAATVHDWARAWSEQRAEDYLALYASSFVPPDGLAADDWRRQRRQRIRRPARIEVTLDSLQTTAVGPDEVRVTFRQRYLSDSFSDEMRKALDLVREDGGWRIRAETSDG